VPTDVGAEAGGGGWKRRYGSVHLQPPTHSISNGSIVRCLFSRPVFLCK
jgi:hypothetical protein